MTKLPPIVQVPTPAADRPSWVKVGVIAAVGFAIGVAWPKLAGVRLGPSAPAESSAPSAHAEPAASVAPAPSPSPSPTSPSTPAAPAQTVATAPTIPAAARAPSAMSVKPGVLLSCKTEDGETLKGKACGALAFDAVAVPRLKKLSECPASASADGKLSVMLHVDFARSGRLNVSIGKSSTVDKPDDFTSCLTTAFDGASVAGLSHDNPRYTLAYAVRFGKDAGSEGSSSAATPSAPSAATTAGTTSTSTPPVSLASANSGASSDTPQGKETGEVVWDVAIVRDKARTGDVVARLPRGTKIRVATFKEGWYQISYGDGMTSEGWVYRRAIGK